MKTALLILCGVTASCGQDLGAVLAAASPGGVKWVGYEVAMLPGHGTICSNWNNGSINSRQSKLMLDGPGRLRILFRVDSGKVDKMLLASEDCTIEPGNQEVVMLPNVSAERSIRYLASREDDSSMYAISLHKDPLATPTLVELARNTSNAKRQKKAFFWLARSKDPAAEKFIEKILK